MPFCGKNLAWNEDLKKYPKIDIEDPEHINLILHISYAYLNIWYPPPKDLPVLVFYWYLRGFTASSRIPPKFDF